MDMGHIILAIVSATVIYRWLKTRRLLYLISATDPLLFVFAPDGTPEHIEALNPDLFPKAEGIAFNPAGDLFISNEGDKTPATILKFNLWTKK